MRWRDWLSTRFAALAIAVAVLVLGAGLRWTQALIAFLVAIAIAPLIGSRRAFARWSPLIALIVTATGLCCLQILPLPHTLVEMLAPVAEGLREDGTALVGTSVKSTLSFDVPGTLRALGYFLTLLGIAAIALRVAVSEKGRYRVIAVVAGVCGVGAAITGVHVALGLDRIYGMWKPSTGPPIIGPLANPNHLGCVMAIGATCALGLAMYGKQRSWMRVVWIGVTGACALTALGTLSRGAALGLGAGTFVTVGVLVAQRWFVTPDRETNRRMSFATSSLPIAVVAVCTVVVVVYAGAGGISQQFSHTHLSEIEAPRSKFAAWRSTVHLIEESPWLGVGRGAFEAEFTRVHPASGYSTFSHVENEYLQAVVDFGIVGATLLAVCAIWLVIAALRRWRDGPLAAGALGSLTVVMLQSNVDYAVELLGIAAPITAIVATLVYVPLRELDAPKELLVRRGARVILVVALLTIGALLCTATTTTLEEDHVALADQHDLTLARLRAPLERHPLDYFNYALAAEVMIRAHDKDAIQVLNHAMNLHPTHPGLHLMAAQLLMDGHHPEQAALEYATAYPATRNRARLITEILRRFSPELAAAALPTITANLDEIAHELGEQHRDDVAALWLEHVLDLHPQLTHACELLYAVAKRAPDRAAAVVDDPRCKSFEPSREDRLALAHTFLARDQLSQAARMLGDVEQWQAPADIKLDAWLALCDLRARMGQRDEARQCMRRLEASGIVPEQRMMELSNARERIEQTGSN